MYDFLTYTLLSPVFQIKTVNKLQRCFKIYANLCKIHSLLVPTDQDYYPSIEQSTLDLGYYHQVKRMLIYNMTIDSAMSTGNVETFWTNRRDANRMNFTFQSIFSPSTLNFPSRPNYIAQHSFGITKADVNVVVTKLNNEG